MERTEIYTSKKKAVLLLTGSLLFVAGGICMLLYVEHFTSNNPLVIRAVGIAAVLFFGFGMYVSMRWIVNNQIILIIDAAGLNVNPKRSLSERIEWKNIEGFSEIRIHGTKIIVIDVNNPADWIEKEKSAVRKRMMEFNLNYCGSPFNISAGATRSSHTELMKILNESLQKYGKNVIVGQK